MYANEFKTKEKQKLTATYAFFQNSSTPNIPVKSEAENHMQWLPGQIILHLRWKLGPNPQDHFRESSSNCCNIQNPKQYAKIAINKTNNKTSSLVHSTFIKESVAKMEH